MSCLAVGAKFSDAAYGMCPQLLSCIRLFETPLYPARLLCPGDFPGKNTGVGCYFLPGLFFIFISFVFISFSFVFFFLVLQSLNSLSPLRNLAHCPFYFLLVFLWLDVDLYNSPCLRTQTHKSR